MGILLLILLLLVLAAAVWGLFFLLCKLGWLLFGKHGNKGPFWASLAATLLLGAGVFAAGYTAYSTFVYPFVELAQTVQQKTSVTPGLKTYEDPQLGIEMTVPAGMEFSKWIHYQDARLQLGTDANFFVRARQQNSANAKTPFSGLVIFSSLNDDTDEEFFQEAQEALSSAQQQTAQQGQLSMQDTREITLPGGQQALFAQGVFTSDEHPDLPVDFNILVTRRGERFYTLFTFSSNTTADYMQSLERALTGLKLK